MTAMHLDETTETVQWRPHTADAHDAAAHRPDWWANAARHDVVRQAVEVLVDADDLWDRPLRRTHVLGLLCDSVEKQARVLGVGRDIHLPRPGVA